MKYLIRYFIQFRKLVGRKIYYLLIFTLAVGFIESIGVALFLPILQNGFGNDRLSGILKAGFGFFHIDHSFSLILFFILVFFVLRMIFLICHARYLGRILFNLMVRLRRDMLNKVFAVDYIFFLKKEAGYINNIIVREIPNVIEAFKNFSTVLNHITYAIMYVILSSLINFKVTMITISLGPVIFIAMQRINNQISHASRETTYLYGKFHSILIQCLRKLKYLKSTLSYTKVSKINDKYNEDLGNVQFKRFFLQSLSKNLFEPIIVLIVVSLIFYYVVALGRNVSEVMFLIFLFMQITRQFLNTQSAYRKFLAGIGSIEVYNNFHKELEEKEEDLNLQGIHPNFDESIVLKNVTVIFPNGKKSIDSVNIQIKPKSVVAFVGHSGSGKSTIANMITGVLKPMDGEVLFGDTNYDRINLKILRQNIGYVTQEDVIFNASIRDNVSLWGEDIDVNKLTNVIEIAHIKGFVNDLPEKQDSMLGDDGLDISGGQRQRITIARELYKDTKLLILDEATSALDTKAEKQIYENLREFKGNKTMVVIAHRLSTVKNADYIYVLDGGRVIEEGTYEELHEKRGEFTKMVEAQKLT